MIDTFPTDKQIKLLEKLVRALKACEKAGVHFHNCYGTLHAFDGAVVHSVDCDEDENSIPEEETGYFPIVLPCCEYSDDSHFVHLKE